MIIVCPGIHDSGLTESFVKGALSPITSEILVFPGQGAICLSAVHIGEFLDQQLGNRRKSPLIFISFSAGVVGAITTALTWQFQGGHVQAFIAIDGWGVPLWGNFPIHRLSHDYFTHWSSVLLGSGADNFYAEPAVEHLSLWRSPQTVPGWGVNSLTPPRSLTAAEFLHLLLQHYIVY